MNWKLDMLVIAAMLPWTVTVVLFIALHRHGRSVQAAQAQPWLLPTALPGAMVLLTLAATADVAIGWRAYLGASAVIAVLAAPGIRLLERGRE